MTANRRSIVVSLTAVLVAALAAWLWFAGAQPVALPSDAAAPAPDAPAPGVSAPAAVEGAAPTASPAAPASEREAAPAAAALPAPGPLAIVRGRCVDAQGAPLAACRALVHGWAANEARMEAWLRDHARPDWQDPPVVATAADGRFQLAFWPPPPFQFTLDLAHDRFAQQSARWSTIAAGAVVDVGDVVLQPGIRVQGRTVDEAGRPVADVTLRVLSGSDRSAGARAMPSSPWSVYASSGADGAFTLQSLLPPGPFRVEAEGDHAGSKPVEGVLVAERPVEVVAFVVAPRPKWPTIAGKVVDETGAPLAGAAVFARSDRGEWIGRSAADGAFVVRMTSAAAAAGEPVRLEVQHDLCEPAEPTAAMPWGSADVTLTARRAGSFAVHVVDEARQPVADFSLRVAPRRRGPLSSTDMRVRLRGPFADGVATLPGLGRGAWTVVVEFPTAAGRAPAIVPIEVAGGGPTRVDVVAPRDVRRTLRLVDGAGQPVAGSTVQLALLADGSLSEQTPLLPREQFFAMGGQGRALVLMAATSDAAGEVALVGPPGVGLVVAALGPGHVPTRRGDVRLDAPGDFVLPVAIGARLRGRAGPPEALATLRRLGEPSPKPLSLRLVQDAGDRSQHLPERGGDARFHLATDGAFDVTGLPAGAWQVWLLHWHRQEGANLGKSSFLGSVTLVDGVSVEFEPDLGPVLPGTLRGTVSKNGAPFANAWVEVEGTLARTAGSRPEREQVVAQTDTAGRFAAPLPAGVYRVHLPGKPRVACAESVAVPAGGAVDQPFTAASGTLEITVRDAAGAGVEGVGVFVVPASGGDRTELATTDAQGRIRAELGAEPVRFQALPKRLQPIAARQQYGSELQAKGGAGAIAGADVFAAVVLELGSATPVAGQTTAVALTLPAAWAEGAAAK
jgi:hypothetical protein